MPQKKRRVTKKDKERLEALIGTEQAAREAGYIAIAGADEVGKGPLAGPVMAACVVMPREPLIAGIYDSKSLSENKRTQLYDEILSVAAAVGIGSVPAEEIDRLGIDAATQEAFARSIENMRRALGTDPDFLFLDTFRFTKDFSSRLRFPYQTLVKADQRVYSVAAASIVAKVTRDRYMREIAADYPAYGFEQNKRYGTAAHRAALVELGPTPLHRTSFLHIDTWRETLQA